MKKITCWIVLFIILIILVYQSQQPSWRFHLFSDLQTAFYPRTVYFIEHKSFGGIINNEYQPGALVFFSLLSLPLRLHNSLEFFERLFIGSNIVLLVLIALFLYRHRGYRSVLILSLILLASGPIVLFRLELLVVFLTLLSFAKFKTGKNVSGWFWLTLAILTKVYPLFLVPYLLAIVFIRRNFIAGLVQVVLFVSMVTGILGLYMIGFGQSGEEIWNSLKFHSQKPIHVESIWATLPILIYWYNHGTPPVRVHDHGIVGLPTDVIPNDLRVTYQSVSLFCIGIIYLWLLYLSFRKPGFNSKIWLTLLLLITVLPTVLTPQYLLWWTLLLPFVETRLISLRLLLTLVISGLTQYVFPLHYSELIDAFFINGSHQEMFWILTARNTILISLLLYVIYLVYLKYSPKSATT